MYCLSARRQPGLVRKYGYPVEVHDVVTPDGYVTRAHRIPRGRDAPGAPGPRRVALLVHGLMCSSADFLVLGPGNALGKLRSYSLCWIHFFTIVYMTSTYF